MRALVPVVAMTASMLLYGRSYSTKRKWAVVPIVLGVALTFYGDISATPYGVFYTALCVILAALKVIAAGELLTGDLKLHPIDLLSKMCPLALIQIAVLSFMSGEVTEIASRWSHLTNSAAPQVDDTSFQTFHPHCRLRLGGSPFRHIVLLSQRFLLHGK